jgi:hypothetical protein
MERFFFSVLSKMVEKVMMFHKNLIAFVEFTSKEFFPSICPRIFEFNDDKAFGLG